MLITSPGEWLHGLRRDGDELWFTDDVTGLQHGDRVTAIFVDAHDFAVAGENEIDITAGRGVLDQDHIVGVIASYFLFCQ